MTNTLSFTAHYESEQDGSYTTRPIEAKGYRDAYRQAVAEAPAACFVRGITADDDARKDAAR